MIKIVFPILIVLFFSFLYSQKLDSNKYSEERLKQALGSDSRKSNSLSKEEKEKVRRQRKKEAKLRRQRKRDRLKIKNNRKGGRTTTSSRVYRVPFKTLKRIKEYKKDFFYFDFSLSVDYIFHSTEALDLPTFIDEDGEDAVDNAELFANWKKYMLGYSIIPFNLDFRFSYVFGDYVDFRINPKKRKGKKRNEQNKNQTRKIFSMPESLFFFSLQLKGGVARVDSNLYPVIGVHSPIGATVEDYESRNNTNENILGNTNFSVPYIGLDFSIGGVIYQFGLGVNSFTEKEPKAFSFLEYSFHFNLEYWFQVNLYNSVLARHKTENREYYIFGTTFDTENVWNPSVQAKINFLNGFLRTIGLDYHLLVGYNFFQQKFFTGLSIGFSTRTLFKTGFENN